MGAIGLLSVGPERMMKVEGWEYQSRERLFVGSSSTGEYVCVIKILAIAKDKLNLSNRMGRVRRQTHDEMTPSPKQHLPPASDGELRRLHSSPHSCTLLS